MTRKTVYEKIQPYITKDGSSIRELMHPGARRSYRQSLAEATILPASHTSLHRHGKTGEIYHITDGTGMMTLGDITFEVSKGDTIYIPPTTPHCVHNTGKVPLKILCCCSPPYSHNDTDLLNKLNVTARNHCNDEGVKNEYADS
jgi:mannose-6-phosphate isomerase-like protein (cupin superfamily)